MSDPTPEMRGRPRLRNAIPLSVAVLLALGVAAGPALAAAAPATTTAASSVLRTSLSPPAGPFRAGTVRLHLVDPTRIDPTSPTGGVRELMVQIWYPEGDDIRRDVR